MFFRQLGNSRNIIEVHLKLPANAATDQQQRETPQRSNSTTFCKVIPMTQVLPVSESKIWDLINSGQAEVSARESRIWELIKIPPSRWSEPQFGSETSGFWAVAAFGDKVLWYNEIEGGFNLSSFTTYGEIAEYWCDQLELHHWIHRIAHAFLSGSELDFAKASPPGLVS